MKFKKCSSESVYDGRIVKLSLDEVEMPDGKRRRMEMIRHPGAAAIVPIMRRGAQRVVLFVRQYRYATGDWLLEIPAGTLDPGEQPLRCAYREVEEETGYRAAKMETLGSVWTTPGFTDERIELFLASGLEKGEQNLDGDEFLDVVEVPFDEAMTMAEDGTLQDAKSICALFRAAARLDRESVL